MMKRRGRRGKESAANGRKDEGKKEAGGGRSSRKEKK